MSSVAPASIFKVNVNGKFIKFTSIRFEVIGRVSQLAAIKDPKLAILGKKAIKVFGIATGSSDNDPIVAFAPVKDKAATHFAKLSRLELCWEGLAKIMEVMEVIEQQQ